MKKIFTLLTCAFGVVLLANTASYAQGQSVTKTATASATIIAPITLSNGSTLSFGSFSNTAAGTVTVAASATPSRSSTGGVSLSSLGTAPAAALFTAGGEPNASFTATLGATSTTISFGAITMPLALTLSAPTTLGTGSVPIYVGGTLTVGANQAVGAYTNSTAISVTVNYN